MERADGTLKLMAIFHGLKPVATIYIGPTALNFHTLNCLR